MSRARSLVARLVGATLVVIPAAASAQLANASNAAAGLGGAYTARAQGYNAVYWNPANLGMPGNQAFSFGLVALDGNAGLRPIDLNRLAKYSGDTIPKAIREQWLLDVERDGGQKGAAGGGVTGLGLSLGHLGLQVTTKAAADMNLAPGAMEAIFFGNKGRYDTLRTLDLAGSSFQTAVYSTGALSYGMQLPIIPLPNFAVGATVKYTIGHGLLLGMDGGSAIGTSDVQVNFPLIHSDTAGAQTGSVATGVGLDLGAAWTVPGFRFGVSMQNVVNTFKWDTTKLRSGSAEGMFSSDTSFSHDTLQLAYSNAPLALREKVAGLTFKPVIAAGLSFDWIPMVTVSADVRQQFGQGIEVGPESLVAAGAEVHLIPFIPLRAGVQMMTGGVGVSGGFGLHFLGFEAGVGGYLRKREGGSDSGVTVNIFSIRP